MKEPMKKLVAACEAKGLKVTMTANWNRCQHPCSPEGDEKKRSFAFRETEDGTILCSSKKSYTTEEAIEALGMKMGDLFPDTNQYEYTDSQGRPVGRVTRTKDKSFPQGHYDRDGKYVNGLNGTVLPLYLAPWVVQWASEGKVIFVVEGEKDARSLIRAGQPATTKPGGANSDWEPEHVAMLKGLDIVVVMDKDDAGLAAALDACRALQPGAKSFKIVQAKHGKDATDHLSSGFKVDDFVDRPDLVPDLPLTSSTGRPVTCIDVADVEDARAPEGVPTGFVQIDRMCEAHGLPKGQMTVWAARKKVGKTSGMTQIAAHALETGYRVLYVTLADLTPAQVWRRMRRQDTGWSECPQDLLKASEWQRRVDTMRSFWELKLADAQMVGGRNVEDVVPGIEALHVRHGFDLVILDYAQKLTSSTENDRVRAMEKASSDLSYSASRHGFALLVGSQVSESGQTRYSQEFEDDCGMMVRVSAPDGIDPTATKREFDVPYQRFGASFSFDALWNPSKLIFEEVL